VALNQYFKTLDDVKTWCDVTPAVVDDIERLKSGRCLTRASGCQGEIDGRLRKRAANLSQYPVPFIDPVPPKVLEWMGALLTPILHRIGGIQSSDQQQQDIKAARDKALEEIKEAADAVTGLYDLPLTADSQETMIVEPATLAYSEQSPFTGKHLQYDAVEFNRRYG
jgi:hypothetical protein